MEQNTKNFDRKIEQMMNEHQVAPPFGTWTRISADLDAMPVAAAAAGAAPVVTSLIPKRALAGIIAAALVIGTSVITGYVVNSYRDNEHANTPVTKTSVATTITKPASVQQTEPVKSVVTPSEIALTKVKVRHIAATDPVQSTIIAAQQVQPVINQPVAVTIPAPVINNENTDVPTPLEPVAQKAEDTQTYFFPPIDVNTPEKTNTPAKTGIGSKSHSTDVAAAPNTDDDKPKRKRFHPARKRDWGYMNINR